MVKQVSWPVRKIKSSGVESYQTVSLSQLRDTIQKARTAGSTIPATELDSWVIMHAIDSIDNDTVGVASKVKKIEITHTED